MTPRPSRRKDLWPGLLIVHQEQFGYHSDTYYYCKYLTPGFRVSYICWDYGREKMHLPGVRVIYVTRQGNLARRNLRFIARVLSEIRTGAHAVHFIKYFRGAALVRLFSGRKKFVLDIRSSSTKPLPSQRLLHDLLMRMETLFFRHVSVISEGLKKRLKLPARTWILPLGADCLSRTSKSFDTLDLLYVGTLCRRNIHETLLGFARFYREYKTAIPMRYTIIGTGYGDEESQLKTLAASLGVSDAVRITGYIGRDDLGPWFHTHNLGVSYVPMTPYYDAQPPTKNFEYLLSGIPVLATATKENRNSVDPTCGIIIRDNPDSFYRGLVRFMDRRQSFDSRRIRAGAAAHTWDKIVGRLHARLEALTRKP